MNCSIDKIVGLIKDIDNIKIVTHKNPDGDAIGSSFALYYALLKLEKKVAVDLGEFFPPNYLFICSNYIQDESFKQEYIISVDLADANLLIDELKIYKDNIYISIDHHLSNRYYAKNTIVNSKSAATTELLYDIILKLIGKNEIDNNIATCLYLGLVTDTGCFKYSSTNANTHYIAAELINLGAEYLLVNKLMFENKSRRRLQLEQEVILNMEYYFDYRCALIYISMDLQDKYAILDDETEGFSAIPMQIEGIEIGITIKEKQKNEYKISIRTNEKYDASEICKMWGGGGHKRAAGCVLLGEFMIIKSQILDLIFNFIAD